MSPILGIWASANQSQYISTTAYESIATVTVGAGGSSSVSFTSIPSTYKHLQARIMLKNDWATSSGFDFASIKLNNDSTAANYNSHRVRGNGAGVYAEVGGNSSNGMYVTVTPRNSPANIWGVAVIDFLDYANTNKYKTVRSLLGGDANGEGEVGLASGLYMSTNAVSQIDFILPGGSNWKQYSSFALYGIKGA